MTKEQVYKKQMEELGIWDEIFAPELSTLCQIERDYTRAKKAWSATAPPGGKPSFLDDHYPILQKLRAEVLQHREALGLTPKALRKLTGTDLGDTPEQKALISSKLDEIAARVASYDAPADSNAAPAASMDGDPRLEPFSGIPSAEEAAVISDIMDEELRKAVAEDMG